jgi:VWFA-related protein
MTLTPLGRFTTLALALAGSVSLTLRGQQPAQETPPVIRASVDQVVIDVIVTDAMGRPVSGLSAADFELRERGEAQTIATFTEVGATGPSAPASAPGGAVPTAAAVTNGQPQALYVLLLDDYHTPLDETARVRAAALTFVERHVARGDRVGVLTTSGLGGSRADPTTDHGAVREAIMRFVGGAGGLPPVVVSRERTQPGRNSDRMAANQTSIYGIDDPSADAQHERISRGRDAFRKIAQVADVLREAPGQRKALLYFSRGVVIPPNNDYGLLAMMDETIGAAARANVAIYAFDPQGLSHIDPNALGGSGGQLGESIRNQTRERILSDAMLRAVSERTGGVATIDRNDIALSFGRVVQDSRHYYLLGYTSTNTKRDGTFRSVEVTAKRPGLRVVARKGYVAAKDKKK